MRTPTIREVELAIQALPEDVGKKLAGLRKEDLIAAWTKHIEDVAKRKRCGPFHTMLKTLGNETLAYITSNPNNSAPTFTFSTPGFPGSENSTFIFAQSIL